MEIMSEIEEYRQDSGNDEAATLAEHRIFNNSGPEWNEIEPVPQEEIKFYPGSIKGISPEDDPQSYAKWFVDHQPASLKDPATGQVNLSMYGVKPKFLKMVQDDTDLNEVKQQQTYYLENDEIYPMATYQGQPEFELFNRENFNV